MFSAASERTRNTFAASVLRGTGLVDKDKIIRDRDRDRDRGARVSDASAGGAKRTAKIRSHAHKSHGVKDPGTSSRASLVNPSSVTYEGLQRIPTISIFVLFCVAVLI